GAIISIAFNPIMFAAEGPIRRFLKSHWKLARVADAKADPMSVLPDELDTPYIRGHIVLVGYGHAGPQILEDLKERKIATVVIDKDRGVVEDLREKGFKAVWGDATEPGALIQAHVQDAALIVINLLDDLESRKIIETVKLLNARMEVVLTTNDEENAIRARADRLGKVFVFQVVMAAAVARYCMFRFGRKDEELEFEEEKEAEQAAEERLARS
ncbi:MAG: NAD-binding protein, partial [Burkholderiales bacterium]|nr:NAD-binding protein [Burkholderiales bacterium]